MTQRIVKKTTMCCLSIYWVDMCDYTGLDILVRIIFLIEFERKMLTQFLNMLGVNLLPCMAAKPS